MGDKNQIMYLKKHVPNTAGPVLEVGSKDYGSTSSFRDFYRDCEYVGIDMEHGKGVDTVIDLVEGTGSLAQSYFDLVICCSVLEHVRKPWVFAEHLTQLVKPGGRIYMSVPWVWRYHAYPDDYFRFSWRGIEELFPRMEWSCVEYSTNVEGEFIEVSDSQRTVDNKMAIYKKVALLQKPRRKYLPYLMVNMMGIKSSGS